MSKIDKAIEKVMVFFLIAVIFLFVGYFWRMHHEVKNAESWYKQNAKQFLQEVFEKDNQEIMPFENYVFIKRADGSIVIKRRMKATLFGLVGDNNPSPPLIFLTPDHKEGGASPNIDEVIAEAAQENQIDPRLIRAVIQVESAGNPKAVSPKGAMGLMQLMPETARSLGVRDHFDVRENILAGARYLKSLINRYNGNIDLALAAYNWGPGNLERAPKSMPMETVQYVAKVKKHWGGMG